MATHAQKYSEWHIYMFVVIIVPADVPVPLGAGIFVEPVRFRWTYVTGTSGSNVCHNSSNESRAEGL